MEIKTTLEKLPEKIRELNISPKTSIRVIIEDEQIVPDSPKKSRWAEIAERISKESPLDEKAGEALRKASREFRDHFQLRLPPSLDKAKSNTFRSAFNETASVGMGEKMNDPLPENLVKYFWDCRFHELNMESHSFFITERILNFGDMESIKWLLAHIDEDFLRKVVEKSRNLDQKTRNYWKLMLKDSNSDF